VRGLLGRRIDMKYTSELRFLHDKSFNAANMMDKLFADPRIQADLQRKDDEQED